MEPIGFAILGAGNIARTHAMAVRDAEGAELTAVHSRGQERGQALADEFDVNYVADLDQLLSRDDVDAVTVATPSGTHLELVKAAAEAGKHVLCEKPLEVTVERTDQLINACDTAGITLACVFQSRQNRNVQRIREALDRGRFGQLLLASAQIKWFRDQDYYDSGGWRGTWDMDGGGALMNQSIHAIDLLCYLAGPPSKVSALQAPRTHERIEVEDTAAALVQFHNNAVGTIEASTSCAPGFARRLEISGSQGSIVLEDDRLTRWSFTNTEPEDEQILEEGRGGDNLGSGASDPTAIAHDGHRRLVQDLAQAIGEGRSPAIPGREGRTAIELIRGIYQAIETGRAYEFPE